MTIAITDACGRTLTLPADPALTLAQAAYLSGHWPAPALCSGLGRCGRCRVRFLAAAPPPAPGEDEVLAPEELAGGWRLGCRHAALPGVAVLLPARPAAPAPRPPRTGAALALAVDLGTTSIHWQALGPDGALVAEGALLNPQMGAGSEVMSRLALARGGAAARLRTLVLDALAGV
ncbi:2Fe-2S iron-sulfur cluster-binding protein, partial [Desulfocurvus sp.]|uniref:2Fe-2S iron-sulfur cluster-binding protein n=1 Tax=Desulfocurvus sp. TaxID=2871698 RepID=UPI0025C57D06